MTSVIPHGNCVAGPTAIDRVPPSRDQPPNFASVTRHAGIPYALGPHAGHPLRMSTKRAPALSQVVHDE
jgi:hypothetical protein